MATTTNIANSTNCFAHDSNARSDEKIVRLRMKHGAAGYGVYFMILERLMEDASYMSVKDYNVIAFDLRVDAALVKSVIEDFGLFVFTDDGKYFYSDRLVRRMDIRETQRKQRSEAGKKGSERRWEKGEAMNGGTDTAKAQEKPVPEPDPTPTPVTVSAPTSKSVPVKGTANDDTANLQRFFSISNRAKLEQLLMNFGLKPGDLALLRKTAGDVVNEWGLSDRRHQDYSDWSSHLISALRIKIAEHFRRTKQTAVAETPPADSEYLFGGGFGGKDV